MVELQDDQLAGAEARGHLLGRRHDKRDVRVLRLPEWRRNADDDGIGVGEDGRIGRRGITALPEQLRKLRAVHVLDVGPTRVERTHAIQVRVDPGDAKAHPSELDGERQPDVALADDGQPGGVTANPIGERL